MTDDQFEEAGGNRSIVHVDFMIGSGELDIDGVLESGRVEPIMRRGEWAAAFPRDQRRVADGNQPEPDRSAGP
jgi:aminopeptidase